MRSLRVRYCRLRTAGGKPVAELEVLSFHLRFGAVAVAAEGIGGVETQPGFRRQGHMGRLLRRALAGMAQRVDVACVSDGIEGVYEQFGFVGAVAEGHLVIPVRNVEQAAGDDLGTAVPGIRSGSPADLPAMIRMYNTAHAQRPWTHARHTGWNRLIPQATWKPGSQTLILQTDGAAAGYAVLQGRAFGDPLGSLTVDELVAENAAAARRLLMAIARLCWKRRLSEFTVREPADGLTGRVARHMGCTYQQRYPPSGGMMAAVLNRSSLLRKLEPELRRRAAVQQPDQVYDKAFDALRRGDLFPDDKALIRLLLGYWSTDDAYVHGMPVPERYRDLCNAWFPGGGTQSLPTPYAHRLDRY
ncbi:MULTISPECIES: GNAT family N-acetyltransferase [unclassified Streptomyces]|uniref:GNAT family N-acetyltransferase n=1 Tax=unclassified Streptomyces TaxID=2593676 RepID=UPI001CEC7FC5|nr:MULTISPECIES: GNAT family N-acetyltransferase [unclassified Streptomyces]